MITADQHNLLIAIREIVREEIVPVYKKGRRSCAENYRPVALTCTLRRILEAVVRLQLKNCLEERNLLPESMCGFRSGKGTANAIARITNGIKLKLAKKNKVMLICIDGRAAFDLARAEVIIESL